VRTAVAAAHPGRDPPPVTALAKVRTSAAVVPTSTGDQLLVRRPLELDERMVALAAAISIDSGEIAHAVGQMTFALFTNWERAPPLRCTAD